MKNGRVRLTTNRHATHISNAVLILFLLSAWLLSGALLGQHASAQEHVLVLSGGTLIDGAGKTPVPDAVVVIRGNRIEKAGPRRQVQIPPGAEIVDTANQFILPGLIDSHFHYAPWMPGELWLSFGVTSAVNYGKAIPQAQPPETSRWPRIFFSGEQAATAEPMTDLGKVLETGNYTKPEQAHDLVLARKAEGATFIKISENLTPELIAALAKEAHQVGLPVIGHQVNAREAVLAGLDGVEHMTGLAFAAVTDPKIRSQLAEISRAKSPNRAPISHPISDPEYYMDMGAVRDILKLMVQHKASLNPTLVTRWQRVQPRTDEFAQQYKRMSEDPYWSSIPQNVRKSWTNTLIPYPEWPDQEHRRQEKEGYRKAQQVLKEFTQMGGKIFSGTDVAGASVPGLRLHQELQLLVDAGLTPMQVILATTRYPAEIYKLDKNLGAVEAGKLADLLVVDADPLQDIRNLSHIRTVILDGKVVPTKFRPDTIIGQPVAQDNQDAARQVAQVVSEVSDALVKADTARLDQLWTDDFTYIHSNGAQQSKPEFLQDVKTGRRKYHSISPGKLQTRFYGNTAVATGLTEMKLNASGRALDLNIRFTSVCVQDAGRWRMASWQSTAIPARSGT